MLEQVISGHSTSPTLAAFEELGGPTGTPWNAEKGDGPSDNGVNGHGDSVVRCNNRSM